jgi:hypothetical protein
LRKLAQRLSAFFRATEGQMPKKAIATSRLKTVTRNNSIKRSSADVNSIKPAAPKEQIQA